MPWRGWLSARGIPVIGNAPEGVGARTPETSQTDFLSDHGTPADGFVCGTGNGCQPNRRSAARGSVHQETNVDLNAPPGFSSARLGSGRVLRAGEGQPSGGHLTKRK